MSLDYKTAIEVTLKATFLELNHILHPRNDEEEQSVGSCSKQLQDQVTASLLQLLTEARYEELDNIPEFINVDLYQHYIGGRLLKLEAKLKGEGL